MAQLTKDSYIRARALLDLDILVKSCRNRNHVVHLFKLGRSEQMKKYLFGLGLDEHKQMMVNELLERILNPNPNILF
jgi:hypothetical protein